MSSLKFKSSNTSAWMKIKRVLYSTVHAQTYTLTELRLLIKSFPFTFSSHINIPLRLALIKRPTYPLNKIRIITTTHNHVNSLFSSSSSSSPASHILQNPILFLPRGYYLYRLLSGYESAVNSVLTSATPPLSPPTTASPSLPLSPPHLTPLSTASSSAVSHRPSPSLTPCAPTPPAEPCSSAVVSLSMIILSSWAWRIRSVYFGLGDSERCCDGVFGDVRWNVQGV